MRYVRLWLLLLLVLGVPGLGWSQGQLINGNRTQAGANNYAQTTGTGTAYVLTLNPALPGYVDGTCFLLRVHVANTGDATLNVNGKGAVPLRKWSGGGAVPLVAGDLSVQQDVIACYDSTNGPRMQVLSLGGGTGGGSADISGAIVNAPLYATSSTTGTSSAALTTGQVLLGSTGNPPVPTTLGTIQASQYGVVCNGSTDTTAALQTVLNLRQAAPRTTTGFVISMPQGGQCKLSATILIDSVNDLTLLGNDVEFIWAGAAGIPMFTCRDCNLTRFENFRVRTSSSAPVSDVLRFENGSGSSITPTRNTVEFVTIECTNGGCTNGVNMALGAGGDANDEFNLFSHMNIQNYTGSCFRIEHAQSKHNFLSHVGCSGNGIGQHFVRVDPRGSFLCEQCAGGGHLAADFHIVNSTDYITIRDSNFESSAALLDTGGPATTAYPVSIENVRWDNTQLRANNRVISYQYRGPLRISGLFVEQGPTPKPTEIFVNPLGGIGSFVFQGNAIATTLADPFSNMRPTAQVSNIRYDGSNWIALQDREQAIPPAPQTLSAGGTLTADACGGTKLLAASSAVTTSTTNTFDAPGGGNVGCRMDVCNTSTFALTLDANANFRTVDGNNVVLGAATASAIQCTSVVQTGTQWVQVTGVGTTGSGGFVDVSGTPTADQLALYVDANTLYGTSTLTMNVTDLDVSTATRTRPNKVGTTAPVSCALGDTFVNSTAPTAPTFAICNNSNTFVALSGGSGTPLGSPGQVQFNNAGAFGGSSALTMDTTKVLSTQRRVTALAASTTLTNAHGPVIRCTAPTADTILTLPAVASTPSSHYELVKTDATAFACQFKAALGESLNNTLNGTASATTQNATVIVDVIDTTSWSAVSGVTGGAITIASGTAALGTSAIASGACATTVTVAATGVLTTDVIAWTPNADISAVTGYAPVSTGALMIYPFPTAGNVGFKVCNPTSASITPGAISLNFRVTR